MIVNDFGVLVQSGKTKTIGERVEAIGDHLTKVDDQMQAGDARMTRIEDNVAEVRDELSRNTEATQELERNTRDLVEFFQAMQGAFRVLNWLGKIARPAACVVGLGTALVGFWAALKGHLK